MNHEEERAKAEARVEQERAAIAAFVAARTELVNGHPHLAGLALRLELVPVWDSRCPTAATDMRAVYFRPDHVLSIAPRERTFLLLHEVLHCALAHFRRDLPGDPEGWNWAQDHEVNDILRRDGFQLPSDCVWFRQCDGLAAEAVYTRLDELRDLLEEEHGMQRADRHPNEFKEPPSEADELEFDPRMPTCVDAEALERWRGHAAVLAAEARSATDPTALQRRILELEERARMRWRELLAAFLTRASGGSLQWLPPSRRHVHRGLFLPSRRNETLRIAVAVDTSGSTELYIQNFLAELFAIATAFTSFELLVISCDDEVRNLQRFDVNNPPTRDLLQLIGGGGTSFEPVFEQLASEPEPWDVLVYLTDGFGCAPEDPPQLSTLWVLVPGGRPPVKWGEVAWMEVGDESPADRGRAGSGRRPGRRFRLR